MNEYASWWDTTITIYNKYTDPETHKETWFRHVIEDCFYKHTQDEVVLGQAKITSDVSICRMRVNPLFKDKRSWNELNSDQKEQFFTLAVGDIIVAGETDFIIDEYQKDHRSSDLVKAFKEWPGCFTVKTASINVGGGRGNEHYYAKGQ